MEKTSPSAAHLESPSDVPPFHSHGCGYLSSIIDVESGRPPQAPAHPDSTTLFVSIFRKAIVAEQEIALEHGFSWQFRTSAI
jgi:hypothetical protein